MAFQLAIVERPGYLHFKVTGENSEQAVRDYLFRVHTTCVERKCEAILVEEHLTGPNPGTLQMFQIASEGAARSRLLIKRVAYVDTNPEHPADDTKFVENVAVNRGMNVRVFATVAQAERWLQGQNT